jgi:hypothetical protein
MADDLPRWEPAPEAVCARCHVNPPGPGGIICPACRTAIEARNRAATEPEPEVGQ